MLFPWKTMQKANCKNFKNYFIYKHMGKDACIFLQIKRYLFKVYHYKPNTPTDNISDDVK